MYDNKFPASILGEILRAERCEYGVEGYPDGADLVGGGNYATPTTQLKNIDFEQTIEADISPTEHANEENNDFEDMSEDLYDRLQNRP